MTKPKKLVRRSDDMMAASYYLARCGIRASDENTKPPAALKAPTWAAAYDVFYRSMGDGRERSQFRNSMKNARDSFDILFDNGRIGWVDRRGRRPSLSGRLQKVHEKWGGRKDEDLESFVLDLLST